MLALVGIPLGIATRKGGKSAGYVIALFLGFFCYHLSSCRCSAWREQRTLPVPVAIWLPDAVFFVAGLIFLARMEQPGDTRSAVGDLRGAIRGLFQRVEGSDRYGKSGSRSRLPGGCRCCRRSSIPTSFPPSCSTWCWCWPALSRMSLVYNFFELMGDMIRNNIPLMKMFTYLFFLTPQLIYEILPISMLVAVLVGFRGDEQAERNDRVQGLRRQPVPAGDAGSAGAARCSSGGLFAFDYYYVPGANRKQDALRDEIKGRAKQTYLRPDRKWIMGDNSLAHLLLQVLR